MNARGLFVAGTLFLTASPLLGAPDPAAKVPPPPGEGIVGPSGKFTPAHLPGDTNAAAFRTPAEAQAALKRALNLQQTGSNTFQIGRVEFQTRPDRLIRVPARVAVRTQIVEYALVTESGKAYESLFTTEAAPADVHLAALLLGVTQVPITGERNRETSVPMTNLLSIEVVWETNRRPMYATLGQLFDLKNGQELATRQKHLELWQYNGSLFDGAGFAAQREGSIISLIRDPSALINNAGADRDNDQIHIPQQQLLPPPGWPVTLIVRLQKREATPPIPPPRGVTPITPLSTNR